ncbi:hypothetical protein A3B45_02700 [Candidatus Daviesbacteria bacterium RIFCSPLOWO2_01_FULL_39_12]|uniref:Cytidyltransferase-like domain-containing protein n=1 Tax=Candidatus Daviesbacteria bacterium RIFCSPLOWO2_01_FULL_39_12 TaxID=1797785 RepID=A0A1F5KSV9_9BACT|nr:MAG: hypothetical protein A3D79_02370 [Candidatus Daviesbacteria bacterium RIFCSPHIGHO2_02_FULL_39_8]OGE43914.1 MAG: hypothetical protein A3B45_02700 [Candidatus Daviesbacteria bacterium RIFCSPLOWO2_01_FULL_39_12]
MSYRYHHLVLGGTFDLLHIGHLSMISCSFQLGKFVTIGITTDQFNQKRSKPSAQNQRRRMDSLKNFLKERGLLKRSGIVFIEDQFGTSLTDPTIEAIMVSRATGRVAKLINQKRAELGLKKLDIIIFPYIKDETGRIISSSRIRVGEVNPEGKSYKKLLLKIAGKKLDQTIRTKLKKPLGPILSSLPYHPNTPYLTVGDITTANFLKAGLTPNLAVVDEKAQRVKIATSVATLLPRNDGRVIKLKNPPGQISKALILAVEKGLKVPLILAFEERVYNSKFLILIEGEEDLATIPAILLSPLGSKVYYGQPNKGLVEVKVDLKIKDYLCRLLNSQLLKSRSADNLG